MKLTDLISFFRQDGTYEDFCKAQKLNVEAEVIEIYAQEPVRLDAELGFFPIEETKGRVKFQSEGIGYHNLFDFFYFLEVVEDIKGSERLTDTKLAQKLLSYAIEDA